MQMYMYERGALLVQDRTSKERQDDFLRADDPVSQEVLVKIYHCLQDDEVVISGTTGPLDWKG